MHGQRARWRVAAPLPDWLRAELPGVSVMLAHLLYCRGYESAEAIEELLSGAVVSHDPALLPDIDAAVARIALAIEQGETVAIYGDFDCDGLTATAVLATTLQALNAPTLVHIPSRDDGHGLHPEALAALRDQGVSLILTADCGIGSIDEVRVARGMGMDVIVTDHHEPRRDGSLPACLTINPRRQDSRYPFHDLCGVGVALKLVEALAARLPDVPDPDDFLDLAALGTVADVVPLRDENRSLVVRGLRRLRQTQRPGLLALFRVAGVEQAKLDPVSLAFYLAPRINAANRLAHPQLAYDLITAGDAESAERLAGELHAFNLQRQALVAEHADALITTIGDPGEIAAAIRAGDRAPLLFTVGSWPPGISGLLATRLVETYGVPAFAGTVAAGGELSVSARGPAGAHIERLLEDCESAVPGGVFLGFGGHARAGGFRASADRLPEVESLLMEQARGTLAPGVTESELVVDAVVGLGQLTLDAAHKIQSLAPFGAEFPEPLFLARRVTLLRCSPVKGGAHARITLRHNGVSINGISFHVSPKIFELAPATLIDAVFHLQINDWNGQRRVELCLRDWRVV